MNQPPLVGIYCRVGTEDEETTATFERQEAPCRAYCEAHGLSVDTVYHEVASGFHYRERELLSRMRSRYRQGEIQGVVVTALDRLSRSQVYNAILMEEISLSGALLYCANEPIGESAIGRFVWTLLTFLAEVEHEKALDTLPTDFQP